MVEKLGKCRWPVLLLGETGTGKEVVARSIHNVTGVGPFVPIDCSSLVGPLMESELFGYAKGAFTGAVANKIGLIEMANGGTAFLDEIGELPLDLQAKLLRVLQEKEFRPVGSLSQRRSDFRVIAATNRDLLAQVQQGRFREDLYYRLITIQIDMPALRERAGDVPLLADHFISRLNARYGFEKRIGPGAMTQLEHHDWPGNVRELLHVVEAAAIVCAGSEILPEHLPASLRAQKDGPKLDPAAAGRLPSLQEIEREHIERVVGATGGHRAQAARILGISERNLYRKLREYGLLS